MVMKTVKTNKLSPDERVIKCGEDIQVALTKYGCQMFTALRIGNADAPLIEIGGLPIVVKVTANDSQAKP